MLKHVVIGVEFSPAWDELGGRLLPRLKAWGVERVSLVHVLSSQHPLDEAASDKSVSEAELARIARKVEFPGLPVSAQVRTGDIARELIAAAHEVGADSLLAFSRGHSGLRELILGSVVLELARLTDLPLWLEPAGIEVAPTTKTLLLTTDGSPTTAGAEAVFRKLLHHAERAVVITALVPGYTPEGRIADAKRHLAGFRNAETHVLEGDPRDVITRAAREMQADLVILGKSHRSPLEERLLGRTADVVCRRSGRSVLLVPPPQV